mmetsp:Transcript_154727/g.268101  ORF Transcript_154727/g.268101 Transcript_154727/m.268101 type:complete len:326 (-) Transcript_154727:157-1134(-)
MPRLRIAHSAHQPLCSCNLTYDLSHEQIGWFWQCHFCRQAFNDLDNPCRNEANGLCLRKDYSGQFSCPRIYLKCIDTFRASASSKQSKEAEWACSDIKYNLIFCAGQPPVDGFPKPTCAGLVFCHEGIVVQSCCIDKMLFRIEIIILSIGGALVKVRLIRQSVAELLPRAFKWSGRFPTRGGHLAAGSSESGAQQCQPTIFFFFFFIFFTTEFFFSKIQLATGWLSWQPLLHNFFIFEYIRQHLQASLQAIVLTLGGLRHACPSSLRQKEWLRRQSCQHRRDSNAVGLMRIGATEKRISPSRRNPPRSRGSEIQKDCNGVHEHTK